MNLINIYNIIKHCTNHTCFCTRILMINFSYKILYILPFC